MQACRLDEVWIYGTMEKEKNLAGEDSDMGRQKEGEKLAEEWRISVSEATTESVGENKAGSLQIPPDFRCPLSLELMSDPVIVASGQTYERLYIQQWLDQGNTTCPKTRQTLTHTNLIPNYTVKALIANWCEANSVPLPEAAKIDPLDVNLKSVVPLSTTKAGPGEQRGESPPRLVQHEAVLIQQRLQERSMSSRPPLKSRRLFQPWSFDDLEFDRNGSHNEGEGHGEASQLVVTQTPVAHTPDEDIKFHRRFSLLKGKCDTDDFGSESSLPFDYHGTGPGSSMVSNVEGDQGSCIAKDAEPTLLDASSYQSDASGEMERLSIASAVAAFPEQRESSFHAQDKMASVSWRRRGEEIERSLPRIVSSPIQENLDDYDNTQLMVDGWVFDLEADDVDVQRQAAGELRLLAKYNTENRIIIANSGAIKPLVSLLKSEDFKTQENAVTALLNLSINDNNKTEIAAAGAIDPLVYVLKVGNAQAMENAAATLFSLSVMEDNKVTIGASGAIPPLVNLLINGTPRGKKDAATALFNLSILHENKARIVRAGAIKPLVELMADPAAGMVDKAVAVLANLATIPEGRVAIGEEGGIPALVEVVEAGSQRGKENAAAALLQLCMNSHRHRALVLQEGAIPPLVALSQSGTARAKEKASALLRHFREQRHQVLGPRTGPERHMIGHY